MVVLLCFESFHLYSVGGSVSVNWFWIISEIIISYIFELVYQKTAEGDQTVTLGGGFGVVNVIPLCNNKKIKPHDVRFYFLVTRRGVEPLSSP